MPEAQPTIDPENVPSLLANPEHQGSSRLWLDDDLLSIDASGPVAPDRSKGCHDPKR